MRIARELLDQIVAHALEDSPKECCGLIGGRDGAATTVYRARNLFESPTRYEVHPSDIFRLTEREIPAAGEELVGIYHSHPKSEALPSPTDVNLAEGWPDPLYLICSLLDRDDPDIRAFAIRDGEVEEVELAAA